MAHYPRRSTPRRRSASFRRSVRVRRSTGVPPTVVTRRRLEAVLWGEDPPDRDVLRTHIYELRKSVDGPYVVKLMETLPKVGYRLRDPHAENH